MSGTPLAEAFVRVRADGTQIKPDVDKALDAVDGKAAGARLGGGFAGSFGLAIKSIGVALAGVFAVQEIALFANDSVQAFSDVEDASAAASVVFGSSMGKIEAQAASAANTMGMSRAQVVDAANTFGTFGKSAGLTGDALADFSTQMTATAGDMASFKGGTPEEAIQAVGAALRGETEPIRRYGVLLDDASMRAQAMKMGLISTTKDALTPQQKVLAAQALILKQTTDAQGDFARTSDSTANTQKTLNATWENTRALIGEQLAPAFTAMRGALIQVLGTVSGAIPGIAASLAVVAQLGQPFLTFVSQVQVDTSTLMPIVSQVIGFVINKFNELAPNILPILTNIQSIVGSAMSIIGSLIKQGTELALSFWRAWGSTILSVASAVINTVVGVIRGFSDIIAGIFKVVSSLMKGDWSGAWDGIKQTADGAARVIGSIVKGLADSLRSIFEGVRTNLGNLMKSTWDRVTDTVKSGINGMMGFVNSIPGKIEGALRGLADIGGRAGKALIDSLAGAIRDAANSAYKAAEDALSSIARLFPHSPAPEGPFSGSGYTDYSGRALMSDFGAAIESSGDSVLSPARRIVGSLSDMFVVDLAVTDSATLGFGASATRTAVGTTGTLDRGDRLEQLLQQLIEEVRRGHVIELDGDEIGRTNKRDARSYGMAGV